MPTDTERALKHRIEKDPVRAAVAAFCRKMQLKLRPLFLSQIEIPGPGGYCTEHRKPDEQQHERKGHPRHKQDEGPKRSHGRIFVLSADVAGARLQVAAKEVMVNNPH